MRALQRHPAFGDKALHEFGIDAIAAGEHLYGTVEARAQIARHIHFCKVATEIVVAFIRTCTERKRSWTGHGWFHFRHGGAVRAKSCRICFIRV